MRHILTLRRRIQILLRRPDVARQPIIFDFTKGQVYRTSDLLSRISGLAETLRDAATNATKPRVVKTVEGIPPNVVTQPKK
jgi:hypothetical protein